MDLETDPGIFNFVFLFQFVDNELADKTPRSYIVGVSPNAIKHFLASFFGRIHTHIIVGTGMFFSGGIGGNFPSRFNVTSTQIIVSSTFQLCIATLYPAEYILFTI